MLHGLHVARMFVTSDLGIPLLYSMRNSVVHFQHLGKANSK